MTTNARQSPAPVPDLDLLIEGRYFGGQYEHPAEYRLTAAASPSDDASAPVAVLRIETSDGHEVQTLTFDRDGAAAIHGVLARVQERQLLGDVPELVATPVWRIARGRDRVELQSAHLDELAAWLGYALGYRTWDYAENGEDWEY